MPLGDRSGLALCPHGAVGLRGVEEIKIPEERKDVNQIITHLETAHPAEGLGGPELGKKSLTCDHIESWCQGGDSWSDQ